MKPWDDLLPILRRAGDPELALIFGSGAQGAMRFESDLDLAVRYGSALDADRKLQLICEIGEHFGCPVDLIDLHAAGPIVARQALVRGRRVFGSDEAFARQLCQTLVDYADYAPLLERALRKRRETWMRT